MVSAHAATTVVKPGETFNLEQDLVLKNDDVLEINGAHDKRCTVAGNYRNIRTEGNWTGRIKVTYCDFKALGG
ncbi:MAG TPA: hypothetical protein VEJ63_22410, partial [Planctomycetota bacterium]|nr:hypothetical protein [Planctomycetota bacterium]